jgi:hypothetical protein
MWGRKRQVAATLTRRLGHGRAFLAYGVLLGSGLATVVPVGIALGVFAAIGLFAEPLWIGGLAGVLFGLARTGMAGLGSLAAERVSRIAFRSPWSKSRAQAVSITLLVVLAASVFMPVGEMAA